MKRELSFKTHSEILDVNKTTESIIGAAIEVHRHLGPGLLECAYEECLCEELSLRGIPF
jgi:GxxExxY protein